ncbi:hypothetical protein [Pararhizobium mangrovi]|uniref:Uncharacterized protein n=1 Tax=Pararhizobium mangrovi TaxID=2590452 RepID=A0A506UHM0_9HYPH|nr:hypothetical protein [Pararhizobium mangrovi]TPW32815.1 hypothetical protein FJU11_00905 [Pararhizobium mangrovi]
MKSQPNEPPRLAVVARTAFVRSADVPRRDHGFFNHRNGVQKEIPVRCWGMPLPSVAAAEVAILASKA